MASADLLLGGRPAAVHRVDGRPIASVRFEWAAVGLLAWLMSGAYMDAWHHSHLQGLETTVLNPWHLVLFSGMLAITAFLAVNLLRNRARGCSTVSSSTWPPCSARRTWR